MLARRTLAIAAIVVLAAAGLAGIVTTDIGRNRSGAAACLIPPVPCLFNIQGEIMIGNDLGAGIMNITVFNAANYPFTNITVLSAAPGLAGFAEFTPFTSGGRVVSVSNQLEIGLYSSGFYSFTSGGALSTTYTITVQATMSNGQTITEKTNIVSDSD